MVCLAQIVGKKDTGKTAVLERVVSQLKSEGLRVLVIKHSHHRLDLEGKDTYRLRKSGADYVTFRDLDGVAIFTGDPEILDSLKVDVILLEGFSGFDSPLRYEIRSPDEVELLAQRVLDDLSQCLKGAKESYNFKPSDILRVAQP